MIKDLSHYKKNLITDGQHKEYCEYSIIASIYIYLSSYANICYYVPINNSLY